MSSLSNTAIEMRLSQLENGTSTSDGTSTSAETASNNVAYATSVIGADTFGKVPVQSAVQGFRLSRDIAFDDSGDIFPWVGLLTSSSPFQSEDPTDYIWSSATLSSNTSTSLIERYFTNNFGLAAFIGDPTYPGDNIYWEEVPSSGEIPIEAFWMAERYIVGGSYTSWQLRPLKHSDNALPFIKYNKIGDAPVLNSNQWNSDVVEAASDQTGLPYSTIKELGYGTVVVIDYDDGTPTGATVVGILKLINGASVWDIPEQLIPGDLIVDGTVAADKIQANSISTNHLVVSGDGAITPYTFGAAWATDLTTTQANVDAVAVIADGEIVGFFQSSAPLSTDAIPPSFGDIWIDTDLSDPLDSTCIFRYQDSNGRSAGPLDWVATASNAIGLIYLDAYLTQVDLDALELSLDDISVLLTGQLDNLVVVFSGSDVDTQTGMSEGDIYIESTTETSTGGQVVDVVNNYKYIEITSDPAVFEWEQQNSNSSLTQLADLTDGKRSIFSNTSDDVPTGVDSDLWIPKAGTEASDLVYRPEELYQSDGTVWTVTTIYTDDTVANSKIRSFYQDDEPTVAEGISEGDLWVNTTGNANSAWRYTDIDPSATVSLDWVQVQDAEIQQALANAAAAQVTANGRVAPEQVANAINANTTVIEGSRIATGSIGAMHINVQGNVHIQEPVDGWCTNASFINQTDCEANDDLNGNPWVWVQEFSSGFSAGSIETYPDRSAENPLPTDLQKLRLSSS